MLVFVLVLMLVYVPVVRGGASLETPCCVVCLCELACEDDICTIPPPLLHAFVHLYTCDWDLVLISERFGEYWSLYSDLGLRTRT